ncbi:helix-turn-helix transcriptional regulator [Cellulomonas sp. P22]|uniref:helix-turn-helix transcriptional regulator n=1 Tax=Cellulomonas sp. P22 TaxID=3373189 RepID=UPI0037992796
MSRPTSRALQILELLQSSGMRTVSELSSHLGVDERTVRRDVEHLRELDVPVEAVRGRYGGYRMGSGYRMPPLVLTDDEAVALLLGLLRAEADPRAEVTESAAATARAKIRRALPDATGRRFDALASAVTFAGAEPAARSADVDSSLLLTVADAVQARRVLSLRYRSASDQLSRREVHPYDLVAYAGRWYLLALDVGKHEERMFRLDRMMSARTLPGTFPDPPVRDAEAHLVAALQRAERPWHVVLRIQATEEHIRAQLPPSVARLHAHADDTAAPWRVAEIHAAHLDWIPGVILALRCPVVIEQPEELRDLVRDAAAQLMRTALGE